MSACTIIMAGHRSGRRKDTRVVCSSSNSTLRHSYLLINCHLTSYLLPSLDEPIYGIYILNRMGTGDYVKRIYPEDDLEVFGKYLMYRYYPEFTEKRLAMNLPYPIPDQYRPAFDAEFAIDNSEPDDPDPTKKRKKQGNSITLGYWAFQQEAHEPLEDVMMR